MAPMETVYPKRQLVAVLSANYYIKQLLNKKERIREELLAIKLYREVTTHIAFLYITTHVSRICREWFITDYRKTTCNEFNRECYNL
jgi:hypothetical protein